MIATRRPVAMALCRLFLVECDGFLAQGVHGLALGWVLRSNQPDKDHEL